MWIILSQISRDTDGLVQTAEMLRTALEEAGAKGDKEDLVNFL